ncbi:molybdopterin-dependent oxidoreductase [Halococcus sp. AFM35]|uniref:molybdopterin-dependent oxidoreductase n=1 Tax=Halococcus sp. AFM35 TaxID=3421653 RepID=UPI003EBCEBC6
MSAEALGFPWWVRMAHFFNLLFTTLLIRSGIEIISGHPKFYWSDHGIPGTEWLRLGDEKREPIEKEKRPSSEEDEDSSEEKIAVGDGAGVEIEAELETPTESNTTDNDLWTAEDESDPYPSWLALPGKDNLGLGRHWHFWGALGWTLTGVIYVVLLFATPQWERLVPTSWAIFPQAWDNLITYLQLQIPHATGYNALQQLTYFSVIFILSPLMILTGLAMSPALRATFPRLLGRARQPARSIHLIGMVVFVLFIIGHVGLVVAHGFWHEMGKIVLGTAGAPFWRTVAFTVLGLSIVIVFHIVATRESLRKPMRTKKLLEIGVDPLLDFLFYSRTADGLDAGRTSEYARVNGRPPRNEEYQEHRKSDFADWTLDIDGLVENPMTLSFDDLRDFEKQTQNTRHDCIQGWTYYAEWGGVRVADLIEECQPTDEANYAVFWTLDEKWEDPEVDGYYYEVIDMNTASEPMTILAYEMNGEDLPIPHGGPLRLRGESILGYKMAKWVCAVEFVEDYEDIGKGQGGWRDDTLNYLPSGAGL